MTSRQASRYRFALASSRSSSATRSTSRHISCCERSDGHSARHTISAFQAVWRTSSATARYKRARPVLCSVAGSTAVESRQVGAKSVAHPSSSTFAARLAGAFPPPAQGRSLRPDLAAASPWCSRRPCQRLSISSTLLLGSPRKTFIRRTPTGQPDHPDRGFRGPVLSEVGDRSVIYTSGAAAVQFHARRLPGPGAPRLRSRGEDACFSKTPLRAPFTSPCADAYSRAPPH